MKKIVSSTCFILTCVFLVFFTIFYITLKHINEDIKKQTRIFKDGVTLAVDIDGSANSSIFDWTDYTGDYIVAVKTAVNAHSFDTVLNNQAVVTDYADSVFYQKTGVKVSSSIEFALPENVEKALAAKKIAELELQTLRYQIARDSLISVAAKKDSHGYTAEAERLESRRDQRFNTAEDRKLKKTTLEVETRKAEALEKAASNVGFLSGDLTIVQK